MSNGETRAFVRMSHELVKMGRKVRRSTSKALSRISVTYELSELSSVNQVLLASCVYSILLGE